MNIHQDRLQAINEATLTRLVRNAINNDAAEITTWTYKPIYGGAGVIANIYRFSGIAKAQDKDIPWSLILKACRLDAGEADPTNTYYWQREALAYESGFLQQLKGEVVAPRCFTVERPGEGEAWLWLEEVRDLYGTTWPIERYKLVARHLGLFNGRYLTQEPMPQASWFSRHWLRALLMQTTPVMARFTELLQYPLAQHFYPPEIAQAYIQLWQKRERLLTTLEHLPQTLCHRDAFQRNLFAHRGQDGKEQTVAIDWADVGIGAIGEELVSFVISDVAFYDRNVEELPMLDQSAFDGYLSGLRAAGWQGPDHLVRLGYAASAPLRYGIGMIQLLPSLLDETQREYWEKAIGHPLEEFADHDVPIHHFLIALANEAQELIDKYEIDK